MNQIDKMFEYNLWANTTLIELCSKLTDEQLEMEADGVHGKIRPFIEHILSGENGYLNILTGERAWPPDIDYGSKSMTELLAMAQLSGEKLLACASQADITVRHDREFEGNPFHFFNWTAVLQAIYHGIEHRTQIKVLLTKLGIEHPDWAAWDYMEGLQ